MLGVGSTVPSPCTFHLICGPGSWGSMLEAEMGISRAPGLPPWAIRSSDGWGVGQQGPPASLNLRCSDVTWV